MSEPHPWREGYLYGLAAYGWWGLVPLYFKLLVEVAPLEVLAHRILWSVVFLALLLTLGGRWRQLGECLRSPKIVGVLLVSSVLIAINWFIYILSVDSGKVVQASLGYFITPLVSVLLGILFLGERLRMLQALALALATLGVLYLTLQGNEFPWLSLTLAFSFSFYALLRKTLSIDGILALAAETIFLLPAALFYLFVLAWDEIALGTISWQMDLLLAFSGVVTTVPLVCFGQAARRLPLSSLGFLQYLSPSIQFLVAVAVFGEPLDRAKVISFLCIWTALILFTVDSVRTFRTRALEMVAEET